MDYIRLFKFYFYILLSYIRISLHFVKVDPLDLENL
jgi:hypothetical protein